MKKLFRFKSIKHKMLFGFILVVVFVLMLGVYNFYATNQVNNKTENIIDKEVPVLIANQQIAYTIAHRISILRSFLATGDEVHIEEFEEYTDIGHDYASIVEDTLSTEEYDFAGFDALKKWEERIEEQVFDFYKNSRRAQARSNFDTLLVDAEKIMDDYEAWALGREDVIQVEGEEVISSGRVTIYVASGISVAVILIGIVIALGTSRTITNPLRQVMERMNLIAEGDLTHEPLETNLRDEIGQLFHSTNAMNDNSRQLLHSIHHVSEQINDQSESLTTSADEVRTGSEQVASTMEDLATGSETQAEHASNLSSMMSQFTVQVEEANENGDNIQTSSDEVLGMTNTGTDLMDQSNEQMGVIDEIVHDAVEKVEGLDDHSKEISELVLVIQDIAEQTNLLALNAAIEAARAGEHGQGFAVVADEVRKLAEKVSHSVTDITGIVDRIQNESSTVSSSLRNGYEEVTEGTTQIRTTRETFQQISSAVENMVNHIHVVSGNLEGISSNTQEMGSSIEEIAAISEESAAGVEQTSAQSQQASSSMEEVANSSRDLESLAEELDKHVRQFKV